MRQSICKHAPSTLRTPHSPHAPGHMHSRKYYQYYSRFNLCIMPHRYHATTTHALLFLSHYTNCMDVIPVLVSVEPKFYALAARFQHALIVCVVYCVFGRCALWLGYIWMAFSSVSIAFIGAECNIKPCHKVQVPADRCDR